MHKTRTMLLAAGCTAAGALGAGAIGTSAHNGGRGEGFRVGNHHGLPALFGAVHAEAVVPRNDGTFATVTFDRGKVASVAGDELTITEGTADRTYKTVVLKIPDNARIFLKQHGDRRSRHHHNYGDTSTVALSDLKAGDRVAVWQSDRKTVVLAVRPKAGDEF